MILAMGNEEARIKKSSWCRCGRLVTILESMSDPYQFYYRSSPRLTTAQQ